MPSPGAQAQHQMNYLVGLLGTAPDDLLSRTVYQYSYIKLPVKWHLFENQHSYPYSFDDRFNLYCLKLQSIHLKIELWTLSSNRYGLLFFIKLFDVNQLILSDMQYG